MKLLLNADDLGYTPALNQAIFELHRHGRLSSASLLVNMPYSQNAMDELRTLLPFSLGLKLAARRPLPQSQFQILDYMLSLHQWMGNDGKPVDLFFSKQLEGRIAHPGITLELVTHPGRLHDPDFPPDTLLTYQRQWEYDFLRSHRFDEWLEMMDAEIVNYRSITQSEN